ncbi:MAG: GntR family transcriptional regulator [Acidobacteria bacterium]|nr:GntR family transcriptional regulator [Acidobacteriota bacterium]
MEAGAVETVMAGDAQSSLAGEAYSIVRDRIVRGDLPLGQVISRRKIAAELGMSFLPVSEALLRLEFEGLLESRPRAGTRVRIPSPDDVRGLYVVREALEVQAARIVCEKATSSERAELKRLAARVDALSMQADRTLYLTLHHRLHRRIAECTRCEPLREAIEKTQALSMIWFCVMRQPSTTDSPRRHQDLVDAIVDGSPQQAADAVREHIKVGIERTMTVLEPYFQLRTTHGARYHRSLHRLSGPAPQGAAGTLVN